MSIEQHGLKFTVDTTGVAKGFRDYKSAVDGIFGSLDKFEAHVAKTMKGVASAANNKAALNSFKSALKGFSDVKLDASAVRSVGALSAAMKDFRAPSGVQSANLRKFSSALGSLPNLTSAYRTIKSIDDLNIAMRGFKAPPASQAKNVIAFANAMAKSVPLLKTMGSLGNLSAGAAQITSMSAAMANLRVPSKGAVANLASLAQALKGFNFSNLGGSANLFATLSSLAHFKAPSPAQTKNLQSFIHTIGTMTVPTNAASVARYLQQIASAARLAQGSMGGLRVNLGQASSSFGPFNRGAGQARLQMMGLQNAFSGTFQIGSALRTLLGSLTVGELGRSFFEANNQMLTFNAQMGVVSKASGFAGLQLDYVRSTANKFGIDVGGAAEGFSKISIAADKSGLSVMQTRNVFEGFSTAMTVLGTTVAGQGDVWLALQQVMNKGYLSAEELNQQMNEKLPGAMAYATEYAKKLGMTLEDGLKKKALEAGDVLGYIAKRYKEDFGPSLASALMKPAAQMTILKNNLTNLYQTIGSMGVNDAISTMMARLNEGLDPNTVNAFAKGIADSLVVTINKAADAISWLRQNWDELKGPLGSVLSMMGQWMILSGGLKIGATLIAPLITLRTTMTGLTGAFAGGGVAATGFATAQAAITAGTVPLMTGIAALNVRTNLQILSQNILTGAMNATRLAGVGLASMFGGVLGLGLAAAAAGSYALYSEHQKTTDLIASSEQTISDTARLFDVLGVSAKVAGNNAATLGAQHQGAVGGIMNFAGATGAAAQQLWELARAQRAANLQKIMGNIENLTSKRDELYGQTAGGMKDRMDRPVKGVVDLAQGLGKAATWGLDQLITAGGAAKDASAQVSRLNSEIIGANRLLKMYNDKPLDTEVNAGMRQIVAPGRKIDRVPKTEKKKTGPSAADKARSELESIESGLDGMMKRLSGDDPVEKIITGWTVGLTKSGQALLTNKGYTQFLENMKNNAASTMGQVDALTAAMKAGTDPKVVKDLANRYHISVDDLIQKFRDAAIETDEKIKEALDKVFQKSFKTQLAGMKRLAEDDLVLKVRVEAVDDISGLAKSFLNPQAYRAFQPTLNALATGTGNVSDAYAQMTASLRAGGAQFGLTKDVVDGLATSLEKSSSAFDMNTSAAKRSMDVVGSFLQKEQDALSLSRKTTDAQEITSKMQELVNDAISKKIALSREDMAVAQQRLEQMQQEAKLLERQKTLFENNGLRQYGADSMQAADLVNSLDKDAMQGLEETLTQLGTTGRLSFKGLLNGIQADLMKYAAKGVTEQIANLFKPGYKDQVANGENPSLFGGLLGKLGIVPNGANNDAGAYKSATDLSGQFGDKTVGQIDPKTGLLMGDAQQQANTTVAADFSQKLAEANTTGVTDFQQKMMQANTAIAQNLAHTAQAVGVSGASGVASGVANLPMAANDNLPKSILPEVGLLNKAGAPGSAATSGLTRSAGLSGLGSFAPLAMQMGGMALSQQGGPLGMAGSFMSGGLTGLLGKAIGGKTGGLLQQLAPMLGMLIPGLGGMGGGLGSMLTSGGGLFKMLGLFSEGTPNISRGAAVSTTMMSPAAFHNAPHYKEGTGNTSGIPAVLHDNEAVIPLSRGRKVPVEMTGGGGNNGTTVNNNFHISTPNADSFKKSKQQLATEYHVMANRSYARNR
jgi:tape measure domain-containing protein